MSIWFVVQIIVNLMLFLALYIVWVRLKKPPQDDPRLSRGLQLLQSKISVLEDLSDRTEVQVKQLNALMEKKCTLIQQKIEEADQQIRQIEQSTSKSLEVAEIFQDKIPHEEVINRRNTIKYVQAAKLAHAGLSVDQILQNVDLPRSEIELIAKVNKDELTFDEENLPEWAKKLSEHNELQEEVSDFSKDDWQLNNGLNGEANRRAVVESIDFSEVFNAKYENYDSLQKLGQEFKKACQDFDETENQRLQKLDRLSDAPSQVLGAAKTVGAKVSHVGHKMTELGTQLVDSLRVDLEDRIEKPTSSRGSQAFQNNLQFADSMPLNMKEASSSSKIVEAKEAAQLPPPLVKKIESTSEAQKKVIKKVQFPKLDNQITAKTLG